MNYQAELYVSPERAAYINNLLELTGAEIYAKYGLKRDETITETVKFQGIDCEMDIKLVVPLEDNETPWTEAVLFQNGSEVAHSDVENRFFGDWELYDGDHVFTAYVSVQPNEEPA